MKLRKIEYCGCSLAPGLLQRSPILVSHAPDQTVPRYGDRDEGTHRRAPRIREPSKRHARLLASRAGSRQNQNAVHIHLGVVRFHPLDRCFNSSNPYFHIPRVFPAQKH